MEAFCRRITDYWDSNANAIGRFSDHLRSLSPDSQNKFCSLLRDAITKHVIVLSDHDLQLIGAVFADDLYKSMWITRKIDQSTVLFLNSTGEVFLNLLRQRGYILHSIINNSFEESSDSYQDLLSFMENWFSSAGFIYICPQLIARMLMNSDNLEKNDYFGNLSRYISEARFVMRSIRDKCISESKHFVLIDADFDPNILKGFRNNESIPGVIQVYRNEPPQQGSNIQIIFPAGKNI